MKTIVTDPFATKGTEYLIVIGFLGALPLFWRYLNANPLLAPSRVLAAQRKMLSGWFRLPETASYHPGPTWAVPAGGGRFRVGLDDFAQKLLGNAAAIVLPEAAPAAQRLQLMVRYTAVRREMLTELAQGLRHDDKQRLEHANLLAAESHRLLDALKKSHRKPL